MSKLVYYDAPPNKYCNINTLINWLDITQQYSYYTLRLCCNKTDIWLPKELWLIILHYSCEPKQIGRAHV